jgi:chemotaxis protein histidine kinase CheA
MRDAHRMKEKFDLSLDNRQIVSLLITGIVVLGAVFVLGVVVGKKLSESDKAAGAPDLLSALDQKAAAMERVQNEPATTFQEELTKKAPPAPRESAPAKLPAALKPEATAKVEPKPAEPKPAEAKPEGAKPAAKPAEVAEVKPASPAPVEAEEKPEPADLEPIQLAKAEKPQKAAEPAKAEPKPEKKESLSERIQAVATAPQDAAVPPTPVATRTSEKTSPASASTVQAKAEATPTKGGFTLQLSAAQTREEADRFASGLKQKGYAPYIVTAQVPGKGTWYRVRLGNFPSRDQASRYLQDFRRETQMEAFVTSKE